MHWPLEHVNCDELQEDIAHANVKEPLAPLSYPRTTNHSVRGVDPAFVLISCLISVSGSSVQLLPLVLLL